MRGLQISHVWTNIPNEGERKMKRATLAVMVLILCLFTNGLVSARAEHVIKYAYVEPPKDISPEHVLASSFKTEIERLTGGRVQVELYPGGILGDTEEMIEQVMDGTLHIAASADAKLSLFYPEIQVLSIPYLVTSHIVAYRLLDSKFFDEMVEDMATKTGLRILMRGENGGFRSFTNKVRPIAKPDDIAGLKFRVMNIPLLMNMVKDLGATPIPMGMTEVYTALQTGVVDGQENAPLISRVWSMHEVQGYYTLDNHTYSATLAVANDVWFRNLPAEVRQAVIQAAGVAQTVQRAQSRRLEGDTVAYLESQGMEFNIPSPETVTQFRELTQPSAIKWLEQQIDAKWINGVITEVEVIEEGLCLR
jgi:tripartite ATP-independent transporter DctP family solute receptor